MAKYSFATEIYFNMSAEHWYSFFLPNKACFLVVDLHWFFPCTTCMAPKGYKVSILSDLNWFLGTTLSNCFWYVDVCNNRKCFYQSIYYKGNQLKLDFFTIYSMYFKLIKTTRLNKLSFRTHLLSNFIVFNRQYKKEKRLGHSPF